MLLHFVHLCSSSLKGKYNFKGPMTASTQRTVLSLYTRVFRIARSWQAQSGIPSDTDIERKYILDEARTLFRQNQQVQAVTLLWQNSFSDTFVRKADDLTPPFLSQLTEEESIKKCIEECEARIEIGKFGERFPDTSPVKNMMSSSGMDVMFGFFFLKKRLSFHLWHERTAEYILCSNTLSLLQI